MSDSETDYNNNNNYKTRKPVKKPPIASYGLIVTTWDSKNKEPLFLLYQRRDTFEYMDFIRGIWSSKKQLPILFSHMTKDEKNRLRQYTLEELWDDLWTNHSSHIYLDGKQKSITKYSSIKEDIPVLLDMTENSFLEEPPWGFPKGKKNSRETDMDTALREFEEETLLSKTKIRILEQQPLTEMFKGTNNKYYCTHYYLAEYPEPEIPPYTTTPQCIRSKCVSEEVGNIMWVNLKEANSLLNSQRYQLLQKVNVQLSQSRNEKK